MTDQCPDCYLSNCRCSEAVKEARARLTAAEEAYESANLKMSEAGMDLDHIKRSERSMAGIVERVRAEQKVEARANGWLTG